MLRRKKGPTCSLKARFYVEPRSQMTKPLPKSTLWKKKKNDSRSCDITHLLRVDICGDCFFGPCPSPWSMKLGESHLGGHERRSWKQPMLSTGNQVTSAFWCLDFSEEPTDSNCLGCPMQNSALLACCNCCCWVHPSIYFVFQLRKRSCWWMQLILQLKHVKAWDQKSTVWTHGTSPLLLCRILFQVDQFLGRERKNMSNCSETSKEARLASAWYTRRKPPFSTFRLKIFDRFSEARLCLLWRISQLWAWARPMKAKLVLYKPMWLILVSVLE